MRNSTDRAYRVVDRLVAVLESFLKSPDQTLTEVARRVGMDDATVARYLAQLKEHGWVERGESSRSYRLGLPVISLGHSAVAGRPLRQAALPHMQRLLERFGETVNLAVKQGRDVVIIDALESKQSIKRGASIGQRDNWFCSSLGKAMLAFMPLEEVNALLEMFPLERRTPNTLSTRKALLDGLEEIRVVGYAIDDEEAEFGLRCVGVPLLDFRGRPTHALSISGPADRLDEQQMAQMGGELLRAARDISHYSAVGASQEGSLAEEVGVR